MRILVLGGTGAMGVHLVKMLSSSLNNQIFVSTRRKIVGQNNIIYVQGNAHDLKFLILLLKDKYDVIIDFMNYRTDEFKERYQKLLTSCDQYIFLSSSRVYANSEKPIAEDSPRLLDVIKDKEYLSTDEYALTKARQENLLMDSNYTNWTIIRPYITYSENRLQLGVLEKESWLYRVLHGRTIVFSKDIASHLTTLTYGLDVARAICAIIGCDEAKREVFNITSPNSIYWNDVFNLYRRVLEKKLGKQINILMTEQAFNLKYRLGQYQVKYDRLFNRIFDNSKINYFVDVNTFVKPQDGLTNCLEHFCNHPIFSPNNWKMEGQYDRLTREHTSYREIRRNKDRFKYYLFRYLI